MTTSERPVTSSVASDDWLPVFEQLMEGLNHSLGNRIAALGGISQLLEMGLASRDEGGRSLASEVKLLAGLLELLRTLGATRKPRREARRAADGLRSAAQLLQHHREARAHRYEIADEPADTEPLLLWRADYVRVGVLFLRAACEKATEEVKVRVRFEALDSVVRIVATTSVAADVVQDGHAFLALVRFASAEGGECTSAAAPGGATALTLILPGLARASAQHGMPVEKPLEKPLEKPAEPR